MKFYVGNLNFRITEDDLRALFEPYGPIEDLIILTDRETGRSRGFGFITLGDDDKAKQAYADLNQKDFEGRTLVMNEARPREDRPQGGNHGGYRSQGPSGAAGVSRPTGGGYSNQITNRTSASVEVESKHENDTEGQPGNENDSDRPAGESSGYSRG